MVKAIWNGVVIAESNETIVVEGNHYFPPKSVHQEYLVGSSTHTVCAWKGTASYYDVQVKGQVNKDAAWFYPEAKPAAQAIQAYIAFWHGVQVKES